MCSENLAKAGSREQNVWILCWRDAVIEVWPWLEDELL